MNVSIHSKFRRGHLSSVWLKAAFLFVVALTAASCDQKPHSTAMRGTPSASHPNALAVLDDRQRARAEEVLNKYLSRSGKGDANAQLVLGTAYCNHYDLPPDLRDANLEFYRKDLFTREMCESEGIPLLEHLANKGNVEAQFTLASLYNSELRSFGNSASKPPSDDAIALKWYLAVATRPKPQRLSPDADPFSSVPREISAANWVADFYEKGLGTEKDLPRAYQWYERVAGLGSTDAIRNVARMLKKGLGTPQNVQAAVNWLLQRPHDFQSQFDLAELYIFEGRELPDAGTKAFNLLTRLAQNELPPFYFRTDVSYYLGILYWSGNGVERDYRESARNLIDSAREGEPGAQYLLATLYRDGLGVLQDYDEAFLWASLSAANGNQAAAQLRDSLKAQLSRTELQKAQSRAKQWGTGLHRVSYQCKMLSGEQMTFAIDTDNLKVTESFGYDPKITRFQARESDVGYKIYDLLSDDQYEINTDTGAIVWRDVNKNNTGSGTCKRASH